MKKIPSYPKITTKTNITVTQTHNININSPKGYAQVAKKMLKNNNKKIKEVQTQAKTNSPRNFIQNFSEIHRKSSKKISKLISDHDEDKGRGSNKTKKSQELEILSQNLKKVEKKIKKLKQEEKKQKKSQSSQKSQSKKQLGGINSKKRDAEIFSQRKTKLELKGLKKTASESKIVKKTSIGKQKIPSLKKHKKNKLSPFRHELTEQKDTEQRTEQLLHEFVTQVPKQQDKNFNRQMRKNMAQCSQQYRTMNPHFLQQRTQPQYYIEAVRKCLTMNTPARQHLTQSLETFHFLKNIRQPSAKQLQGRTIHLPPSKFQHTIVLDLDETLIHCNQSIKVPYDVKLAIKFPGGQKIQAGINIRPFAKVLLKELAQICEVIVFTASHECYANVVLDYLDPEKRLISHRLFRQHCWHTEEGIYIKDLRVLGNRNLQNVLLVDNAAYSYYYQLANGIPILPFYHSPADSELVHLLTYLHQLIQTSYSHEASLRDLNNQYFKLDHYIKYQHYHQCIHALYGPY